jgi:ABC-type transporter Mla subunit MlaD
MGVNTPKRRGEGKRELRDVLRDLRSMLGHAGKRDREIILEAIEGLQDLAQRLHDALAKTTTRAAETGYGTTRHLAEQGKALDRLIRAAENETHGEEETDATGKP